MKLGEIAGRAFRFFGSWESLSKRTESDLYLMHGVGRRAVRELRRGLEEQGLAFAPEPLVDEPAPRKLRRDEVACPHCKRALRVVAAPGSRTAPV